jgi:UDP-glucuronate 4-epimerase
MRILLTGAAGFIGFHVSAKLLDSGYDVLGVDNLNDYYDVGLKKARLALLQERGNFQFLKADVVDRSAMTTCFESFRPSRVVHLAAQAGVRYSIDHPELYVDSNLVGFANVLEACRRIGAEHLVYASSSSVYGSNTKMPFTEDDSVDHPISLYAATKKANELMAHVYSHLFQLPTTGLRLFTVYGPWGRPDMAYFLFARAILEDRPIEVFNNGNMRRSFTYIDDIVEGVVRALDKAPVSSSVPPGAALSPATSAAPYRVYNIGNPDPIDLLEFIGILEDCLGRVARKVFLPMQPGDVPETFASVARLQNEVGFSPTTPAATGIRRFVDWYLQYYKVAQEAQPPKR